MVHESSWQTIRDKFLPGAVMDPGFLAHWDSHRQLWTFLRRPESGPADLESTHLFKETTRMAIGLLPKARSEKPSWQVWMDLMRNEKRGFRRIPRARNWHDVQVFTESGALPPGVPTGEDGEIARVFKESADFCEDLASNLEASGVTTDNSQTQTTQSSSEMYDPLWHVRGGGDDPETPRESFKRLARRAVVALGQSFSNRSEAVDAWLSRLHEFHAGRKAAGTLPRIGASTTCWKHRRNTARNWEPAFTKPLISKQNGRSRISNGNSASRQTHGRTLLLSAQEKPALRARALN